MHSFDQVRFRGFEHEMKVVAHQYISMDAPAGALASLPESRQKGPAVLVVSVNGFPPIPAVKHVVDGSGKFDAFFKPCRGVLNDSLASRKPTILSSRPDPAIMRPRHHDTPDGKWEMA